MPVVQVLAVALPILGSGVTTDVAVASDVRSGGGLAPNEANEAAEPQAEGAVTVSSGLRIQSRSSVFMVSYSPRLYVELPEALELGRPLLLHQVRSSYATNLSPRTQFDSTLDGGAGELSYSDLSQVFDPSAGVVQGRVIPLLYGDLTLSLNHRASRRHTLGVSSTTGYRGPLEDAAFEGDDEFVSETPLPKSFNTSVTLSDAYAVTSRDGLRFSLRGGYLTSDEQSIAESNVPRESMVLGSNVAWTRSLNAGSSFGLTTGVAFNYALDLERISMIPNLVATHTTRWRVGRQEWISMLSGGMNGFLDEVTATFRPQGFANWSLSGAIGRYWTTGVNLFGATSLDPEPQQPPQYESNVGLILPSTYRVSLNSILSFGVNGTIRGPHLLDTGALRAQGELTAYVGYRIHFGTDESQGSWLR